ncbi:MAG: endonuclease MutS2 [Oscillospiraceae bacterium]|jgi:DNA mismatch repair protein MutS2|nr:endonuclease MutS2 [Oscillospiraceae bacterium]
MNLTQKSLNTLELPALLEILAEKAGSDSAKEQIRLLRPVTELAEAERLMRETSDAKLMTETRQTPGFANLREIGSALSRTKLGGTLNTRELLNISSVLRETRQIAAYGEGSNNNSLAPMFWSLRPNKFLEEKIDRAIVAEDEISDSASSELYAIRRHIRAANSKVRDILQKIISSPSYQKSLQESIITQRSGRFVVPVRAEHKGAVPGIVHDTSSSGATLFVEPMSVVNANNEIRELEGKEKREIERILAELSAETANFADDILNSWDMLVALDVIFAKAALSYEMKCAEPILSSDGEVELKRARHPLLSKDTAVPVDVSLGKSWDTLVITGPNTGGKTVSIKTLGLLCAMAACGLHIPVASGSVVPIFRQILADIGDEQSIEQSLSTFSSHMTNIVAILGELPPYPPSARGAMQGLTSERGAPQQQPPSLRGDKGGVLILLDELGAGTDPAEGAALATAIIEYARQRGAKLAVTTHYAELKLYALQTEGVENASCEFDVETLKPTYRLITGIPGKSNAFAISERLGLNPNIIEDAKQRVDSGNAEFEAVIANLQAKRQEMERLNFELRVKNEEIANERLQAETLRKRLEDEKVKATREARGEAERIIVQAREQVKAALEIAQRTGANPADAFKTLNDAEKDVYAGAPEEEPETAEWNYREIKPGDTVELLKFGTKAEVISVNSDGELELKAGILTVRAGVNEVRLLEDIKSETQRYLEKSEAALRTLDVHSEVDLRGMDSEEATAVLERYIDNAVRANLLSVRIIHGKGTGALRAAVQNALKRNKNVKKFRIGSYGEGDFGVTVADL